MSIKGNTVGTSMPRTDFNQENPAKADYLKGREDLLRLIATAKAAGDNAYTAAGNARTAADNAQTSADNAQSTADNALPKAGGTMEGHIAMSGKKVTGLGDPTDDGDATSKKYVQDLVDGTHLEMSATLTVNDWEGDAAPYTQTIGIDGILEKDKPHISPVYDEDQETRLAQREAWMMVCDAEAGDGEITFTCFEDKPATAVPIQIEVNR